MTPTALLAADPATLSGEQRLLAAALRVYLWWYILPSRPISPAHEILEESLVDAFGGHALNDLLTEYQDNDSR